MPKVQLHNEYMAIHNINCTQSCTCMNNNICARARVHVCAVCVMCISMLNTLYIYIGGCRFLEGMTCICI